jgi:tRNA G18 (ribose-2'-O)-methylase SpoU
MEGSEENDGVEQFEALPHFNVDWVSSSNALVLGKEGPGLSEQVRQSVRKAEIRSVYIPMEEGIESLNVGTCGSVIMFEFHRQILQR